MKVQKYTYVYNVKKIASAFLKYQLENTNNHLIQDLLSWNWSEVSKNGYKQQMDSKDKEATSVLSINFCTNLYDMSLGFPSYTPTRQRF